jgi:hypothetical protein
VTDWRLSLSIATTVIGLAAPVVAAPDASDVEGWESAKPAAPPASSSATTATEVPLADDTSSIAIELVKGKVVGSPQGQGKAEVTARVTNNGQRRLAGVRIGAYYDTADYMPAATAPWKLHEFVLEPPLEAGGSVELEFTDEAGAEYILLRVDYARFGLAVTADGGKPIVAEAELLVDGPNRFITLRDLARAVGAKIEVGADKRVSLMRDAKKPRPGLFMVFTPGTVDISVKGKYAKLVLASRVAEGRLYVPLQETTSLLGYSADYNAAANLLTLTTR